MNRRLRVALESIPIRRTGIPCCMLINFNIFMYMMDVSAFRLKTLSLLSQTKKPPTTGHSTSHHAMNRYSLAFFFTKRNPLDFTALNITLLRTTPFHRLQPHTCRPIPPGPSERVALLQWSHRGSQELWLPSPAATWRCCRAPSPPSRSRVGWVGDSGRSQGFLGQVLNIH